MPMSVKIIKQTLKDENFTFNSMIFKAEKGIADKTVALFTHGYTASKSDQISWATRLSDAGISSIIFDLPGHHLGSFNEISSFETFTENAVNCFHLAYESLLERIDFEPEFLILGGHSLGALLSIKALELPTFSKIGKLAIAVGLGISQHETVHLFNSSFYAKTLNIRRQLVCESIDSDKMFPWISSEKENISVSNQRIHLITGRDDIVVGLGGVNEFAEKLEGLGNNVSISEPARLPHNNPELAGSHIYSFLKKELNLK